MTDHGHQRSEQVHRRQRIAVLVAAVTAVILLAGCGGSSSGGSSSTGSGGTPLHGGTAEIANFSSGPNYIFPLESAAYFFATNDQQFSALMWRPLYWFGVGDSPKINYALSIGEPPVYTNGGKTVTVTLKHYVWSNGTPVTSRDVIFWMNLLKANRADWGDYTPGDFPDNVVSTKAVSPTKVQFTLTRAFDDNWFTYNELAQITPLPTYAWDKTSATGKAGSADETPAGAQAVYKYLDGQSKKLTTYATNPLWKAIDGPWQLKSYTASNGDVTFVPNPKWVGKKPYLSAFKEKTFTTTDAEFNALEAGEGPSYGYISPVELSKQPQLTGLGYTQAKQYSFAISYLDLNFNNPTAGPLFKQLYIRQVLMELINQVGIDKAYFSNTQSQGCGPVPPVPPNSFADSIESHCPYSYNPAKAASTLTSHGWTIAKSGTTFCSKPGTGAGECGAGIAKNQKLTFTFIYQAGGIAYPKSIAQIKSDMQQGAGITLILKPEAGNTLYDLTVACKPTQSSCGWQISGAGGWVYSPDFYPTGEALFQTGAGYNPGSYSDPKADALIKASTEPGNSQQTLNAYQDYLAKQLPVLWQQNGYGLEEIRNNLHGVTPFNTFSFITPETWYFTGSIPKLKS